MTSAISPSLWFCGRTLIDGETKMRRLLGFVVLVLSVSGVAQNNLQWANKLKTMSDSQRIEWAAKRPDNPLVDSIIEGETNLGNAVFKDSPANAAHYRVCIDMRIHENKGSPACTKLERVVDKQMALVKADLEKEYKPIK
jgi:hypothetical protein